MEDLLIALLFISKNDVRDKHFKTYDDFEDYIVNLNREFPENSWWVFKHDVNDSLHNNEDTIIAYDLLVILGMWRSGEIRMHPFDENFWNFTLIQCESEEDTRKHKK